MSGAGVATPPPSGDPTPPTPTPPATPPTPPAPAPAPAPEPSESDPTLGDAGKRAIKAEREARQAAEAAAAEAKAELEKLRAASMSEHEKAIAEAERKGRDAATADANRKLVRAHVRVAAVDKVADVNAAITLAGDKLDKLKLNEDGEVDAEQVTKLLDGLLADYPFLAKTPAAPPPPKGDGGPQGSGEADELGKLSMEEYRKRRRADRGN